MKISVKAHPKSKQQKIVRMDETHWEVWVSAAPDKDKANKAIIEAVSTELGIAKSNIRIVSGMTSKNKTIEIIGKA